MRYIDRDYYINDFGGDDITEKEFNRLCDIASEVIYDLCNPKPTDEDTAKEDFQKAICYEMELIIEQGGVDVILGQSTLAQSWDSESLGNYSITAGSGSGSKQALATANGIPVSSMAIMILRRLGLYSRWAFAEYYRDLELKRNG